MTSPANNASFYADFGALAALKRDARTDSQKALRAAAQQFESLFTDMMLKSMRAASIGDALTGSGELDMYQGMFDQQLAAQLSKGKGLGLADMLVQQLMRSGLVPADHEDKNREASATTAGNATSVVNLIQTVLAAQARMPDEELLAGMEREDMTMPVTTEMSAVPELVSAGMQSSTASTEASRMNWPPASPEEFVQNLLPHAEAAARQLGVDPATLVAHAALETGWGKHVPGGADGGSSFNLFGIKAMPAWQGQSVAAATLEYEGGVAVRRVERFKAYDSPAECFGDYARLLAGASRYSGVRNSGSNAARFAQSLQQGGYATDPQYASKLRAVTVAVRAIQAGAPQVPSTRADI
ncbi:MAG: flagellar assembly peptidoglycan hydrolase FlgJ [Steroidobacteraceae bacterium]